MTLDALELGGEGGGAGFWRFLLPLLFLVALNVSRSVCCGDGGGGVGGGDEVDNVRSRQLPRTAPVVLVHGRVSASNQYRSQFPLSLLSH